MSARAFEAFLTRIYVDAKERARFKANPRAEAQRAGLSEKECADLENFDWIGLEMAARSFAHKRQAEVRRNDSFSIGDRLHRVFAAVLTKLRSIF